jgi:hypothetical protein
MIGSIPSHSDQLQSLSDDYLYPQQLSQMYPVTGYNGGNPSASYVAGAQQAQQFQYPMNGNGGDGGDHSSELFQQSATDFRQGSFADVGAAFGFHPDHPIQISSQNLPQSSSSHFDGYPTAFHNPPQFLPPLPIANVRQPLPEEYQAAWAGDLPNSDAPRYGKRQRRSQYDSDEDEANEPGEAVERKPTRLCVGPTLW